MLKAYIAHNYAAKKELSLMVEGLKSIGIEVVSRWLVEFPALDPKIAALNDLEDVDKADCLIFYPNQFGKTPGRGKFIEFGYAYAKGKKIYIVGDKDTLQDSVFYSLPGVEIVGSCMDIERGKKC